MDIDIIQLINLCFSNNYILFISISNLYVNELKCKKMMDLYINIYWCYIFDNKLLCREYMIKFIKTLHFMK